MEQLLTLITLSCLFWTASSLTCRSCVHTELPAGTSSEVQDQWQAAAESVGQWDPACKAPDYNGTIECEQGVNACLSASYTAKIEKDGKTGDGIVYQRMCAGGSSVSDAECKEMSAYTDLIKMLLNDDSISSLKGQACSCLEQNCNGDELQTPDGQQEGHAAFTGPVIHVMLLSLLIVLLFD